jgi:hypothetical protein
MPISLVRGRGMGFGLERSVPRLRPAIGGVVAGEVAGVEARRCSAPIVG